MADIREKVEAEFFNIENVLQDLLQVKDRPDKERVVIVGMAAYLQNICTGMENILKQLVLHRKIKLPDGANWHKELLFLAADKQFVSGNTADQIGKYLVFRHFIAHSYGFMIDENKLKPLVDNNKAVYLSFKQEVLEFIETQ